MVAGGYLQRDVDEADRRRLTVSLTERGRAAARAMTAARRSVDSKLLALAGAGDVEIARCVLSILGGIGRSSRDMNQEGPP